MKLLRLIVKYLVMFITMLMPRNHRLYVFGAWLGERFADNSKQLFIEANKRKNIRAVWISKDEKVVGYVKSLGYEAFKWGTLKAVWVQLRAGYAVVSNGISDLQHTFLGRAVIIDLWHGIPLKKICYDNKYEKDWDSPRQKFRDKIIRIPLGRMYYVATSETFVEIYKSAFRCDKEHVLCLGQPRSDIFFEKDKPKPYFKGKNVILYCPTHRKEGAEIIDLKKIFDLDRLEKFLSENNYYFVVKKHFYHRNETEELDSYPHIIDITGEDVDIQRLIIEIKAMITDYSSIYIDYLLLDKPILFYCYDYERYLKEDREMYFKYEDVTPGVKARDFNELMEQLEQFAVNESGFGEGEREKIKNFFYCKEGQKAVGETLLDIMERGMRGFDYGK